MGGDQPPPIPVDPDLENEKLQAQNQLAASLQQQSQGDTANLMARYGTRLAISGVAAGSPLSSPGFGKV